MLEQQLIKLRSDHVPGAIVMTESHKIGIAFSIELVEFDSGSWLVGKAVLRHLFLCTNEPQVVPHGWYEALADVIPREFRGLHEHDLEAFASKGGRSIAAGRPTTHDEDLGVLGGLSGGH